MDKLITDAMEYLSSSFLVETEVRQGIEDILPFQIRQKASAYIIRIEGTDFLCIASDKLSVLTSNNFLYIRKIVSKIDLPVIIISEELDFETRRMIKKIGGGWIIPNKYSFISSLFIHKEANELKEKNITVDNEKKFGVIPSYLMAYYLCGYFDYEFVSFDIIDTLKVSKMAVSRAIKELIERNIIVETSEGKLRSFEFSCDRQTLWNRHRNNIAELSTGFIPVKNGKIKKLDTFLTGESALSKYTLISPPFYQQLGVSMSDTDRYMRPITPATIEGDYFFKALSLLEETGEHVSDDICLLQIFPYAPVVNNGYLDKIFLSLSRVNKKEIRVKSSYFELETDIFQNLKNVRSKS
ncbi:hypothetical protein [Kosakonia sp. Marseille-Q7440]